MKQKAIILIVAGLIFICFGLILNSVNSKQYNNGNHLVEYENQVRYNQFIENKFSSKYFSIKQLNSHNKQFADIKIDYNIKNKSGFFYLKTQWLKKNNDEFITIPNFKEYSQNNSAPLFNVIGIAGEPNNPQLLYIIPANIMYSDKIPINKIESFRKKKVNANFYFDAKSKSLK
ncbi:hypothetical protein QUF75_15245 [Desulfococcaceae bacterium HSG7]|nr:hypothetical protein [Desulfococcaceae bacterium HSG7]